MKLLLPTEIEEEIAAAANAAFPRECCGLIEGVNVEEGFAALALHPAGNLADAPDRFEINPADHIAAAKQARARGRAIIGCYHSHPDGTSEPSPRDEAGAGAEDFLWLIAGCDGARCEVSGFVYQASGFAPVDMVGADLVTSSSKVRG